MPDLLISGQVIDISRIDNQLPFTVELRYELTLGRFQGGFRTDGLLFTNLQGQFAANIAVTDAQVESLAPQSLYFLEVGLFVPPAGSPSKIRLQAFLPESGPAPASGNGQQIFTEACQLSQGLVLHADFSKLRVAPVSLTLQQVTVTTSSDILVSELLLNSEDGFRDGFWSWRSVLASAVAKVGRDGRFIFPLIVPQNSADGRSFWMRIRKGSAVLPLDRRNTRVPTRETVIARTRVQTDPTVIHTPVLLIQISKSMTLGELTQSLPEKGSQGGYTFRDLRIALHSDGRLGISFYVGQASGWDHSLQWIQLGRFSGTYVLSVAKYDNSAFDPSELDTFVIFTTKDHTFDFFPETDFNEVFGIFGDASQAAAAFADKIVKEQIAGKLADTVKQAVDEKFESMRSAFGDMVDELKNVFFFEPISIAIDINHIGVTAIFGIMHEVVAWTALGSSCPGNTMMAMTKGRSNLLPGLRHIQRVLEQPRYEHWHALYQRHRAELTRVLIKEPALAWQMARCAGDLHELLEIGESTRFSPNLAGQLERLAESVSVHASKDMKMDLHSAVAALKQWPGRSTKEVLELAAKVDLHHPKTS